MPKRAISSRKAESSTKRSKHAKDKTLHSVNVTECEEIASTKRSSRSTLNPKSIIHATDEPTDKHGSSGRDESKPQGSKRLRSSKAAAQTCSSSKKENSFVVKKQNSYKVKIEGDTSICWITGIAITNDGRILVVDRNNNTVKFFSQNMKLQSSLKLQLIEGSLFDVTVINDNEAVLNTSWHNYLLFLDISGDQLRITRKQPLPFPFKVTSISRLTDKLVAVTDRQASSEIKMFDLSGNVYWTVSEDLVEGQCPYTYMYVATHGDIGVPSVAVTENNQNAAMLISGEDGTITRKVQLKGEKPKGVTFDRDGNLYVCLSGTNEIVVLSSDMSEQKVLLTKREKLRENPQAIAHDNNTGCLIVSYSCDFIDIFKIS